MKMAVSIQRSIASVAGFQASNTEEALFSDKMIFEMYQDEKVRRVSVFEIRVASLDILSYHQTDGFWCQFIILLHEMSKLSELSKIFKNN